MTTTLLDPPRKADPDTVPMLGDLIRRLRGPHRVCVSNVDWNTYEELLDYQQDAPIRARIIYDRGELEIVPKSLPHELWKDLISLLLRHLAFCLNIRLVSGGEVTISRRDLDRGIEPDGCFFFGANLDRILPIRDLDFSVDPPPDLAIEVERSVDASPKLTIYAALGVPEVWRYDGETITVAALSLAGEYEPVAASRFFPTLPLDELARFVILGTTIDSTTLLHQFDDWVRKNLLPTQARLF